MDNTTQPSSDETTNPRDAQEVSAVQSPTTSIAVVGASPQQTRDGEQSSSPLEEQETTANIPTRKRLLKYAVPFWGIAADIRRRLPWYLYDIKDGLHPKILTASLFMFFASIAPALSFGEFLFTKTEGQLGVTEVLFATAICGILYAIVSGQPLIVVGVTGPISIFISTLYTITNGLHIPFIPFIAATGVISACMHLAIAIFNMSYLIRLVTRFTTEIFGALIAVIYIYTAIEDMVTTFEHSRIDAALLSTLVTLLSCYVGLTLQGARSWIYLPRIVVKVISDCAIPVSIVLFTGIVYIGSLRVVPIQFLNVESQFKPTMNRNWFPEFGALPYYGWLLAIVAACILTILSFFDHNVSSLLSQKAEFNLKKGSAYHWDFFCVGALMLLCGLLGIPFAHGLIPQAPLHVQSLSILQEYKDSRGHNRTKCVGVRENRLSALLHDTLILVLTLWGQVILRAIPRAVMPGLFLFMGITSFEGNQFVDRIKLCVTNPQFYGLYGYRNVKHVRLAALIVFTVIQFICWAIIFGITMSPASLSFPVLIVLLIPLRKLLLPLCFSAQNLHYLDNEQEIAVEDEELGLVTGVKSQNDQVAVVILELDAAGNILSEMHVDEKVEGKKKQEERIMQQQQQEEGLVRQQEERISQQQEEEERLKQQQQLDEYLHCVELSTIDAANR